MDNYRHREQPQSIGVGVLLVPLLVMALVLKFSMNQFGVPYGDRAQPPPAQGEARVPGFGGALDTSAGRLLVRLAPLHSDPVRQRFDTLALGERFGRTEGEPWRLVLNLVGRPDADVEGMTLDDIVVVDDDGLALEPVLEPVWPREDGALDPVAVLFAPPPGRLFPGEEISFVLWGRKPGARATVDGVGGADKIDLREASVPHEEFLRSLARLDRERDEARIGADLEKR